MTYGSTISPNPSIAGNEARINRPGDSSRLALQHTKAAIPMQKHTHQYKRGRLTPRYAGAPAQYKRSPGCRHFCNLTH
jgi:hypothetical protein